MTNTLFARPRALTVAALTALATLSQCGIGEQVQQARAFKDVDVRLANVEQATLAGVDVLRVRQPADLSGGDQARIAAAFATGNLPLRMRFNLEFRNPNPETAALNELDYIALLDGQQVATGRTTERIEVAANGGTATAPITLESNLRDAAGSRSGAALADFVLGLADRDREPLRLTLRLKPTFVTSSGRRISPGGYTDVKKEFRAADLLNKAAQRPDSVRR